MNNAQRSINAPVTRPFPDVILRNQFFELMGSHALTSEQRLMLAVLADAINIIQDGHNSSSAHKRASFIEASQWMFTKGVNCPLAFDSVCDALEIDPDALRSRLTVLLATLPGAARIPPLRLRLKEASRVQRLTLNRVRRRGSRRPQQRLRSFER
ncbi:MAG: hypothetical protein ACREQB_02530 [Candidatus Binataceae bacterium]